PIGGQVEETAGLDYLEPFVHQSSGVNRDSFAHFPGRMIERLRDGNRRKFRFGSFQKRTPRSSQPDSRYFSHLSAAQALMDGVMFTVNRQQRLILSPRLGGD